MPSPGGTKESPERQARLQKISNPNSNEHEGSPDRTRHKHVKDMFKKHV